jgi:hypothetical protein
MHDRPRLARAVFLCGDARLGEVDVAQAKRL